MGARRQDGSSRLSPRLAAVGALVPRGCRVAEVGSDHALLPMSLLEEGKVPWAMATEKHAGRLTRARTTARRLGIAGLDLRAGDGLSPLTADDRVEVVVVAGLGGNTARRILDPELLRALGVRRVVVQPQTRVAEVREHLDDSGWGLVAEAPVAERNRYYEVLAAEPGRRRDLWEHPTLARKELLLVGPLLVREARPEVLDAWSATLSRLLGAGRTEDDPEVVSILRILSALRQVSREPGG